MGTYKQRSCIFLTERFCGVRSILQADKDNWHIMGVMVAVTLSAVVTPVYNLPLLIMHRNSPILLCYYQDERENPSDGGGILDHSIIYWLLLGFDCAWLYIVLTFATFLSIIALNILTGIPLILAVLSSPKLRKAAWERSCGITDSLVSSWIRWIRFCKVSCPFA